MKINPNVAAVIAVIAAGAFSGQAYSASTVINLGALTEPGKGFSNTIYVSGAFADYYAFSIPTVYLDSIATSISLGPYQIQGLAETLYTGTYDTATNAPTGPAIASSGTATSTTTTVNGSPVTIIQAAINGVGLLQAGNFVLEISGQVPYLAGTYAGQINIATSLTTSGNSPVPVPAAVWMVGPALAAVGGALFRRKQSSLAWA